VLCPMHAWLLGMAYTGSVFGLLRMASSVWVVVDWLNPLSPVRLLSLSRSG